MALEVIFVIDNIKSLQQGRNKLSFLYLVDRYLLLLYYLLYMNEKPRRSIMRENSYSINSVDVSFSIPDWKQKQIQSINEQYQKQIFSAVPLSLTDFDSKEEVEFLSPPEKCTDQKYAYQRKLLHNQDFSILAFILCIQQLLIGDTKTQSQRLEKFKKKISEIDLCCLKNIPPKMKNYYDNKVLKKILFQYINKGSYNVSLLEVLLRRNNVLKFSLSLVSKSILKRRGIIENYNETIPIYIEMRNCGDQFEVLSTIKVRQKYIETQNFFIKLNDCVQVFRKQNVIKNKLETDNRDEKRNRSLAPSIKICKSNSKASLSRKSTKDTRSSGEYKTETEQGPQKPKKSVKRSNSLVNFFRKLVCF